MDFFQPRIERPNPQLSAFSYCAQWLEDCPWPANQREALNAVSEIGKSHESKLHKTIPDRFKQLQFLLNQPFTISQPSQSIPMAPTLGNVHRPPAIRYFRALVWNLENFTHDPRPSGTKPIDSERNQARIAIVADFAFRIGADALLIMETGSDVGQAMTQVADCWTLKEKNSGDNVKRSVEPLVSPATHGLPELPLEVPPKQFKAEADKVRALMLIGEGYSILPAGFPQMTNEILHQALTLLVATSNNFQTFKSRPQMTGNLDNSLSAWANWCREGLFQGNFETALKEDLEILVHTINDAATEPEQFLSRPDIEFGRVREAILAARDVAAACGSPSYEAGVAEVIQLLLLSWILRKGLGTLEPYLTRQYQTLQLTYSSHQMFGQSLPLSSQLPLWLNNYGEPADLVVLALLLGAGQPLILRAHDQENGAIFTATDGELLLNGLIRLEILAKPHAETYGVVYRPYTPGHLEHFLNGPFEDLGFSTEGIYGILHGDKTGSLLVSQQPKHVLAGRSALKINFPVTPELWVPIAVHHNRYTASKEIKEKYDTPDHAIQARLETIEDEGRLLAGHNHPPLIVGDFNISSAFVQAEIGTKSKTKAGLRRAGLRENHVLEMGVTGYLRRRRNNETNPETTLKRALTIAKGGEIFSEPYDAVYQPFDFLRGTAIVRSAAIRNCDAFFPPNLLKEPITATTMKGQEQVFIGKVLFNQIIYIYSGISRLIIATLTDAEPWLAKNQVKFREADNLLRVKRDEFGQWLWQRKLNFQKLLWQNFYQPCPIQEEWFPFMKKAIITVTPFVKEEIKLQKAAKKEKKEGVKTKKSKISTKSISDTDLVDDDMLDEEYEIEIEDESGATKPTKKGRPKKPGEQRMMDLGELFDALINLEMRSDLRLWGAYTHLVSDHLPILVEVEFPS